MRKQTILMSLLNMFLNYSVWLWNLSIQMLLIYYYCNIIVYNPSLLSSVKFIRERLIGSQMCRVGKDCKDHLVHPLQSEVKAFIPSLRESSDFSLKPLRDRELVKPSDFVFIVWVINKKRLNDIVPKANHYGNSAAFCPSLA